jgi:hypothetical protein
MFKERRAFNAGFQSVWQLKKKRLDHSKKTEDPPGQPGDERLGA